MKISYRIFFGFALLLAAGYYFMISFVLNNVNVQPKKSMEESMLDTAHVLAAYLEQQVVDNQVSVKDLSVFMANAGKRKFSAHIYEMTKTGVYIGVYVTDRDGKVIFDTGERSRVGEDYSRWYDVKRTLQGKYGARTTRDNPDDPLSSVAYVAAPIVYNGEIIGVCTVYKPWGTINLFVESSHRKILIAAVTGFIIVLVLSFFISRWITRAIRKLTEYAEAIKDGRRTFFPDLGSGEVKELGDAFESMRESLEGKKYIEKYVQTLTHQLKGPLSAIRGAAELLQENIPEAERKKFINNIDAESNRMQRIVERMLELASLEQQRELKNVETIDLNKMIQEIGEALCLAIQKKGIALRLNFDKPYHLKGERFLLYQAIYNLLHNAVEFTGNHGTISVDIKRHWDRLQISIQDNGAGIPPYALEKIFEKFYSLPRPGTGQKSSGLGLALVKEVAELHRGQITITNAKPHGALAVMILPVHISL